MMDQSTIPSVAEAMARRVAERVGPLLDEDPGALEHRLTELDGWALTLMLRVTAQEREEARTKAARHMGVIGVDHSLNRLVIEEPTGEARPAVDLEAVDLDALDDEDLIAAAHYVPETLPGYLLG